MHPDFLPPKGEAVLCLSVSSRPGRFGVTVHNAGYRGLGLNFVYRAAAIDDIGAAMDEVRRQGIRGCSVSMPFKEAVLAHMDALDPAAAEIGAVNTVVNDGGKLTGFNTDFSAVDRALAEAGVGPADRLTVLGAGGVARAIVVAARRLGMRQITVCARRPEQAKALASRFACRMAPWSEAIELPAEVLANGTPLGMAPDGDLMPVPAAALIRWRMILDAVATPPVTRLIAEARRQGVPAIDGWTIGLYQAAEQFERYTGRPAPLDVMRAAALTLLPP